MVVDRDDVRRALRERVERQVHARGIPRHVIETAVDQVVAALPLSSDAGSGPAPARGAEVVATFSAVSAPDLASRVRHALEEDGVSVLGLGSATAGRHTVVTVLARGDEPALGRAASRASATLTVLPAATMERA
jgi:hypothetical protein